MPAQARVLPDLLQRLWGTESQQRQQASKAVPDFPTWLTQVTPSYHWEWPHIIYICQQLDRLTRGEIDKLMLFLPPRHGKSETVTVRYSAWRLERNPETRIIIGAYNQFLANTFSRKIKRIVQARQPLAKDRVAVEQWETATGGGVRAVGVGGGITGMGGSLIVIDDPTKNRAEAESEVYREGVWNWYVDDLYTRREPGAKLLLIQTRWHHDDLAGRILASDDGPNWTVVSLPAEAEEDDPLGRSLGAALCPERFDEKALAEIHTVLGSDYIALYQQRPTARGGDFFKRVWFPIIDIAPVNGKCVRFWDLAATEAKQGKDPDWTAGAKLMLKDGITYIADIQRTRATPQGVEYLIRQTAELDGKNVPIFMEQEPGNSGVSQIDYYRRNVLQGWPFYGTRATGSKEVRAAPLASQAEGGNVRLVRGAWNAAFLEEIETFPHGKHDDQIDSVAGAYNQLTTAYTTSRVKVRWG